MTDQPRPRTGGPAVLGDRCAHGIAVHLTDAARVRAAQAHLDRAAASADAASVGSFWVQHSEHHRHAPHAVRARQREVRRALSPDDPGLRVVLTRYADGGGDLVAVAHRGVLDHTRLRALLQALTRDDGDPLTLVREYSEQGSQHGGGWSAAPAPQWGLATDAYAATQQALPQGEFTPEVAAAAAAVALARYERARTVRLAVVATEGSGTAPGARVVSVPVGAELPLTDLLAQVRAALAGPAEPPADDFPPLCLVLTGEKAGEEGRDGYGEEYVPFAPDAVPLVLAWHGRGRLVAPAGHSHDPAAVHPAVAQDFARHTAHLAAQLADAGPGRTVADLALLDDADAAAALGPGRTVAPGPPRAVALHQVVAELARRQPEATAVCDERSRLGYRELDERATAWARELVRRGAGPGQFVGVCLKRTVDLVTALLAVLKTGAAYVPLDPQAPDERLRHIAQDAQLVLVVSTLSGFPAGEGVEVLRPQELTAAAARSTADTPLPTVGPEDAAYVIYTSGTTGRPKGVVVAHSNVLALLDATTDLMALGPADVWTFFHSAAFDFSVWEIWGCLLTGGRLVVVPYLVTRSPEDFHALVVREGVTVLSQTPSAFAGFLEMDARSPGAPVPRLVVLGGEAFDPRILGTWFSRHPDDECRLVNMYGITETTVHVTARHVRSWDARSRPHGVGRPLPGWSVSVRDDRGRPLPAGAVGEMYVGGAGLALGYLNRAELTEERFVTDPVSGERLYRSGDLGQLRLDGTLDCTGRLDDQVKIRGFRIELGEIRAVLLDDPCVLDAAVLVEGAEAGPAHARLVGYAVLTDGTTAADVRRRIATVLPDYMVPAELVALPKLPMTLNGKVDRAALPSRRPARAVPEGGAVGHTADPAGPMLAVWREVITADLGPHDHFFEAGGNSLLAVRLLAALRRAGFGSVAMRDLYSHPTPAALAALVGAPAPGAPATGGAPSRA
ncbi:amino acid adenylation domain-containing protein [Streptomyces sp. NPDC048442]|uniref:amino acid adenylation domain-containing protein n=1 Tax=Streptomyces sp. NPDC048442 TaxID=3154823 RepID=UPI003412B682